MTTLQSKVLAGLRIGPNSLPELLPFEDPIHHYIAASNLERAGRIQRAGKRYVNSRTVIVWQIPPVVSM